MIAACNCQCCQKQEDGLWGISNNLLQAENEKLRELLSECRRIVKILGPHHRDHPACDLQTKLEKLKAEGVE